MITDTTFGKDATYPLRNGPSAGPMNGETVYTAMGPATSASLNRSLTVPPATLRNAELQKPVKNRKIR